MLNDLNRHPQAPERDKTDAHEPECGSTHFRAALWLSIAADIRRERLSRETKGFAPC